MLEIMFVCARGKEQVRIYTSFQYVNPKEYTCRGDVLCEQGYSWTMDGRTSSLLTSHMASFFAAKAAKEM
jgi:hypothetical protein